MDIDQYYSILEELSASASEFNKATHTFMEELIETDNERIRELIDFRKTFIGTKELEEITPYLSIGFFNKFSGVDRTTCFIICFELNEIATKIGWQKRCAIYKKDQPLFEKFPNIFIQVHNDDLIDFSVFEQINGSEILKFNNGYTYIDFALNPMIASWTKGNFPDKKMFIRANPFEIYERQPPQMLFESILMPANPNWWRNLTIYNRTKEGASYVLEDCSPKVNLQQYWELHVKQIKRLEVIAKRNNNGNLSMMIEEITSPNNHGLVFGRCIHLDTDSPYGTPFEDSVLNHLDLAINIYEGETAIKRLEDNLAFGIVTTDASYRTHLIKVLDIPFKALFGYVISFLKSQTLISEWIEDQFRETVTK